MMMLGNNGGGVMVKIGTADVKGVIGAIRQAWTAFNPQTPFTYYFLDDRFAALYAQEQKTGEIFSVFAALAILIASLGLFGLVAFTTEQRAKEIGIRKVLGASVAQVTVLLSKNLLGLVVIAMAIAIPLTGIAMHWWLENFAYRTGIRWWIFVLAGSAALLIAIATISFRSIKAALSNPVKSLRTE
jgi:putative ABC transport system permease protein